MMSEETNSYEGLEYDLERIIIPVTIKMKDGPKEFELREADGEAAKAYRNASVKGMKFQMDTSSVDIGAVGEIETVLVSKCLYYKDTEKNVSLDLVTHFPNRVIKSLFDKAMEISNLSEDETPRELLGLLLDQPNAPISLVELRDFADKYSEDPKLSKLRKWLKPTAGEKAKN